VLAYFSSHLRCSLRFYPFCSFALFQRSYCWASLYHSPRTFLLFSVLCASLEVLFPSAFAVSVACISQAFHAWHSPLLRFLIASAVLALCGLSSLFHLETLMGFSFRAFSCKRLVAPSYTILSCFGAPSAFYRWLLHAHDFVMAALIAF
jgi:hypothetical protein